MYSGRAILQIAESRVGEKYILGSRVPMNNPNFHGPWDCAEFVSWSVYQAYGILIGVRPPNPATADAYTGYWAEDAELHNATTTVARALRTPGAILLRRPHAEAPGQHPIGHIAISRGDGTTVEARGKAYGVVIAQDAAGRPWDIGVLIPGVEYAASAARAYTPPADLLMIRSPFMRGPQVVAVQRALEARSYTAGVIDGVFAGQTEAAVYNFQAASGTATDGVVGAETAGLLGLAWPIVPTAADVLAWNNAATADAARLGRIAIPAAGPPEAADARPGNAGAAGQLAALAVSAVPTSTADIAFETSGSDHFMRLPEGKKFYLGTEVGFTDDMARRGLYQPSKPEKLSQIAGAGKYNRSASEAVIGKMAYIIWPTVMAESSGYFARLNSYDRAAFTFGCYQAAAHTPNANLIVLFRRLLELPNADRYFPDLFLVADEHGVHRVHERMSNSATRSLEDAKEVRRPNGKVEVQLPDFMTYLNSNPAAVDDAERTAAARLYLWLLEDPEAGNTQVRHAADTARTRVAETRRKIPGFAATDWREVIWVNDIRHQGRGGYAAIKQALESSSPIVNLAKIGVESYPERVKTVRQCIEQLGTDGSLHDWSPADLN